MTEAHNIAQRLRAPFLWSELEHRQQGKPSAKGNVNVLTYVQRKAIIDRLDSTVGIDNWRDEYELWTDGKAVKCRLHIRLGNEWVCKEDVAEESDIEAVKGGVTGAFKRAASKWGIGLYLYGFPNIWLAGKVVGDKTYLPNDHADQILREVRSHAPHLLAPEDGGVKVQRALAPRPEPAPEPPPKQPNLLVPVELEPAWLELELGQGRFAGHSWRYFTEPSEDGGRIGYLVHLLTTDPGSEWGERAAVIYLYRCTKRWFDRDLRDGRSIGDIDIIQLCTAKGLQP